MSKLMNPPPGSPLATQVGAQTELDCFQPELERLGNENRDLEMALLTSNEHGDLLQEQLYRLSTSLTAEVRERQAAEERLQKLVQAINRGKGDLEILVQILMD